MQDNISQNTEALIRGIKKATGMVKGSYGAAGGNIVVEDALYPYFRVTNDGKLIVDAIKLADSTENMGANIIKEAGDKADKDSGDGRKTTMILVEALFDESAEEGVVVMDFNRSLNECIPIIHEAIDAQKREITVDQVGTVATTSSENPEIGAMIQEIYQQIGKDGIIEVDNSNLPETFYEVTDGVRLRNAKFFSPYSQTEPGKAIYKHPKILIAKDKITSVDQLDPLIGALKARGIYELTIYFDDIDLGVASRLALTHIKGEFKTLLIKAPTLWKDWLFEDFAKITGATIVDSKNGKTFKNLTMEDLGTCTKIISDQEETRVIGIKDITEHLEYLNTLGTDEGKLRASWLQTKVAILKVGANSESELAYRSKKARDACNASYLALKDGVVAGGGVSLINATFSLPDTVGGNILREVLKAPMKQILTNSGKLDRGSILYDKTGASDMGFNAKTGEGTNMFEAGIIDPALVVKNAVKNAISIASIVLTAKGSILLVREPNHETNR